MMRKTRAAGGFSLIEVLVAFSVMALALGVIYQSGAGSLRAAVLSDQNVRAALWAQSLLASRQDVPPDGWSESGKTPDGFSWVIVSHPVPAADLAATALKLHEVTLDVQWTDRGKDRSVHVATVLPEATRERGLN